MKRIVVAVVILSAMVLLSAMTVRETPVAPAYATARIPSQAYAMAGKPAESIVKWMTFEEAVEKSKTEKRKIIIDVFTDWCGWCKVMDKNTFNDPEVAKLLNEKFYPVKFDAEQTADIEFRGTTYKFIPNGGRGTHQLAYALLNNQLSYPTIVFIEEDFKSVSPIPGMKKREEFHKMLMYFAENLYKKGEAGRAEFEKIYKSPYQ
jgi:thioredoxin-related protein